MKTNWLFLAPLLFFAGTPSMQAGRIADFIDAPAPLTWESPAQEYQVNVQGDSALADLDTASTTNPLSVAQVAITFNVEDKTDRSAINIESGSSNDLSSAGPLTFYANGFSTGDIIGYELSRPWMSTAALVATGALIILIAVRRRFTAPAPAPSPAPALKFNTSSAPARP